MFAPPESISALSFALDGGAIFSRWLGQIGERCVLPMPPPHPVPNAEVNYGGVSSQRRRTERRKSERRFMYRQEWDPSLPHTLPMMLLISHTHTHTHIKASASQLCVIIQSDPTRSHSRSPRARTTPSCHGNIYL